MNWRNPKKELPKENQTIWGMVEPHKWRGSMLGSACSIQIVSGLYWSGRLENNDEYGCGSIGWNLDPKKHSFHGDSGIIIAWLPIEEMPLPEYTLSGAQ